MTAVRKKVIGRDGEHLLFLLGLPRSGTTLLAEMLGNDVEILAPSEPWLMFSVFEIGRIGLRHAAGSQSAASAARHFIGAENLQSAQRDFACQIYGAKLQQEGCSLFLDKTPRYYQIADQIAALFPAARFIILRRNPVDVALSYRDSWNIDPFTLMRAMPDDPAVFDLVLGPSMLDAFMRSHPARHIVVDYETLAQQPVKVLGDIYKFIGRRRSNQELAAQTELKHKRRATGDMGDHKILSTQSVHGKSIGAWRQLSKERLAQLVEWLDPDIIAGWGYGDVLDWLREQGWKPERGRSQDYRLRAEQLYQSRISDAERINNLQLPISEGEQADIAFILSGRDAYVASGIRGRFSALQVENQTLKEQLAETGRRLAAMDADHAERGAALTKLTAQLQEAEADRSARGEAMALLTAQLQEAEADRANRARAIAVLEGQLRESEADRSARGEAVAGLAAQLQEAEADRANRARAIAVLEGQLRESEADRSARGEAVARLAAQLQEAEADRANRARAIAVLEGQLRESEADRSARGEAIKTLTELLREAESDRATRGAAIESLSRLLEDSEADRAERLKAINLLEARLQEAEADRAARGEAIEKLTAWLKEKQ